MFLRLTMALALPLGMLTAAPVMAQDDDHDDHEEHDSDVHTGGIGLEVHGDHLDAHGGPVFGAHEQYEFVEVNSNNDLWSTVHGGTSWPGFQAEDGSFSPGTALTLNVDGSLRYWDGVGNPSFESTAAGTTLTIQNLGGSLTVDGDTAQGSFTIGNADSGGGIHSHPAWNLTRDGDDPLDGAYLFTGDVSVDGLDPTERFGVVFHKNLSDAVYESSFSAAESVVVPEPTAAGVFAFGLGALALRRRRQAA